MRINIKTLVTIPCMLIAGYCFGGHIGLGIAAVIITFIQFL